MKNSVPHDVISGISEPAGRRSEKESRLLVMSNRAPIRLIKEGGRERIEPTVGGVGSTFLDCTSGTADSGSRGLEDSIGPARC